MDTFYLRASYFGGGGKLCWGGSVFYDLSLPSCSQTSRHNPPVPCTRYLQKLRPKIAIQKFIRHHYPPRTMFIFPDTFCPNFMFRQSSSWPPFWDPKCPSHCLNCQLMINVQHFLVSHRPHSAHQCFLGAGLYLEVYTVWTCEL